MNQTSWLYFELEYRKTFFDQIFNKMETNSSNLTLSIVETNLKEKKEGGEKEKRNLFNFILLSSIFVV